MGWRTAADAAHAATAAERGRRRILRDIQYVYAPLAALQAALPEHWRVVDRGNERELRHGRTSAIRIRYATMPPWDGAVRLDNRVEGYRLDIDTVADAREPG